MIADDLVAGWNVWPNTEARLRDLSGEYEDKKVLVTGACGSIGGLLYDWFVDHRVQVIGIDHNEWEVFKRPTVMLGDYATHTIPPDTDYVFHCAAYKHLPLGEKNLDAFQVNNFKNVVSWWNREREHLPNDTKIVLASSDKAAGNSNLGRSKKNCETSLSRMGGVALRLANVAGSHGSVLDLWDKSSEPWCAPHHVERLWMSKNDAVRALLEVGLLKPGIYALSDVPRYTMGEMATAWENRTARRLRRMDTLREGESDRESMVGPHERMESETPMFSRILEALPGETS